MSDTSVGRDQRLGSARTVDQVIYTWLFPVTEFREKKKNSKKNNLESEHYKRKS